MPISRQNLEKELVPGLHALIGLNYKDYGQQWSAIFDTETSKRSFEEETKLVGLGAAVNKPEGEGISYDEEAGEAWTARYVNQTYALGFILTEEAIEDELYDSLGKRYSAQLGRSMAKTKEIVCANVINFAFNGGVTGGDGKSLCATDHPTQSGIVNSNKASTGTDLNESTLENAIIQISEWVDERGFMIAAMPQKLIIPAALTFVAERILTSPYQPGTANNDINAIKQLGKLPGGYTVNNYLTDPDAWFLKTNVPDGLKLFQRVKLTKSSDGDFDSGNKRFKARERYSVGYTDPLAIWGSAGAA